MDSSGFTRASDWLGRAQAIIKSQTEEVRKEKQAHAEAMRASKAADLRQQLLKDSRLPGNDKIFSNYQPKTPKQAQAVRLSKLFVDKLPNTSRGLMLHGPTGVGKSHLLKAVVYAATQKESPIRAHYANCFSLQRQFRADPELAGWLIDCQLLALDDIDKSLGGDVAPWVRALVKDIVEQSVCKGSPILIATSENSLDAHKSDGDMQLYLASRLARAMHWQAMDGPDGRQAEVECMEKWWEEKCGK